MRFSSHSGLGVLLSVEIPTLGPPLGAMLGTGSFAGAGQGGLAPASELPPSESLSVPCSQDKIWRQTLPSCTDLPTCFLLAADLLTYLPSFTDLPTYLLACLLAYLLSQLLAYCFIACVFACLLACLPAYLLACILTCLLSEFIDSLAYLLVCLRACVLACLLAYFFVYVCLHAPLNQRGIVLPRD